jgi:hypothetical protein
MSPVCHDAPVDVGDSARWSAHLELHSIDVPKEQRPGVSQFLDLADVGVRLEHVERRATTQVDDEPARMLGPGLDAEGHLSPKHGLVELGEAVQVGGEPRDVFEARPQCQPQTTHRGAERRSLPKVGPTLAT